MPGPVSQRRPALSLAHAQELALAALEEEDDDAPARAPKRQVFFCSRTHSQLAQIVGEVQKTEYAACPSPTSEPTTAFTASPAPRPPPPPPSPPPPPPTA